MSSPGTRRPKVEPDSLNPPAFSSSAENARLFNPQFSSFGQSGFNSQPQQPPTLASQRGDQLDTNSWADQQPRNQGVADYPLYTSAEEQAAIFDFDQSINPADLSLMSSPHDPGSGHSSHQSTPSLHIPIQQQQHQDSGPLLSSASSNPSAAFEWEPVYSSQQTWSHHRRAPSEYSEISSAAASPFMPNQEFSEQASPLLQPGSMQELLRSATPGESFGLDTFSLNDRELSPTLSPHSERNSPYLNPQSSQSSQFLGGFVPSMGNLGPPQFMHPPPPAGHGAPTGLGVKTEESIDDGSSAPMINVIFAPPQRQPTFPHSGKADLCLDDQALSPPPKSPRRQRSKSDPFSAGSGAPITRPLSPGPGSGTNSPARSRRNSLSPSDARSDIITAPVGSTSQSKPNRSRSSSTSSLPNRDYILELAHPNRPGATPGDNKRVQKHPATFQCHLCPKKFTRAYNLRSHLRTHTDERPFVCTICGKAFARQHDRKRHEGLHSGEKKFVCRGTLKAGGNWGCGRRFARADALGRHFRSEAGRVCIRPLLDEEMAERERQQRDDGGGGGGGGGGMLLGGQMPPPLAGVGSSGGGMDPSAAAVMGGFGGVPIFPSALLEQYPALANVDWSAPAPAEEGVPSGGSGRSSFDASAGEWESGGSNRNSYDGSADWASGGEGGWTSDGGGVAGGYR